MTDDPYIVAMKKAYTESKRDADKTDHETTQLLDRLAHVLRERDHARGVAARLANLLDYIEKLIGLVPVKEALIDRTTAIEWSGKGYGR